LPPNPLVSIIVPSFNQGRFIRETLDSILAQDYRPIEIHVIDGASTDDTLKVLQSYGSNSGLHWVSEPDSGVVEAVNKGFAKVVGPIVAIQSSDDMYLPGAIRTMVNALLERPRHGLVYADFETIDENGTLLHASNLREFSLRGFLCKETWIPQPTAFFRKDLLDVCGGWDSRYFNADTELWLRMAFRTEVQKIDGVIARRRLHDAQRNQRKAEILDSYMRMVKDSADLREAGSVLRRSARAGVHMHAVKYSPSNSLLTKSYHLWTAGFLERRLWPIIRKSPLFIPGWLPAQAVAGRLKKKFLSKTR